MQTRVFTIISILGAGAALAHDDVKNPVVKARMDGMSAIGSETKTLGSMAKRAVAFDSATAHAAAKAIAGHAAQIPKLFAAPEDDPASDARPAIWTDFEDFSRKASALQAASSRLATSIGSLDDLRAGMAQIGQACQSCHSVYRD